MCRVSRHLILTLLPLLLIAGRAAAFDSFTATVSCYDGVNLTTGMTEVDPTVLTLVIGSAQEIERIAAPDIDPLFHFSSSVNTLFALTADPARPVELQPQAGVAFAVLEQTDPASLTEAQLAALDYAAQPVAVAPNQVVVAKLDNGAYRIVGQVAPNPDATVQFTVWTPETGSVPTVTPTPPISVPEPGTFALFAVGMLGIWKMFKHITKHKQRGSGMNIKNPCLGILAYLLLSVNLAAAAKVTVVKFGTGNGEVEGEGFYCGSTCQKEYPENTVLQLKAIPDEGSRFVEWMVNGVRQEGTIRVSNEEMIVSARFEMLEWELPEFVVWWYNGNDRSAAFLAGDEIVVHFDEQQVSEEELQQAIDTVTQQLGMLITIRDVEDFDPFIVWFQTPAITSFEEFETLSQQLKQFPFVKRVSPVLYKDPENRNHWLVPTGEILVEYPATSTETQIDSFEAKYHLVQSDEGEQLFPRMFTYRVENPLNALECSRQVYESGLVIYSWPVLMKPVKLLDDVPLNQDDPFLDAQWNFRGESEHGGNIFDAWTLTRNNLSIQGTGVTIGIVEPGGVYIEHEDLIENVNRKLSSEMNRIDKLSFVQKLPPEKPKKHHSASHGTSTAGVAAGRGANGIGISGVAPRAAIAAYRVDADPRAAAEAFTMRRTDVDIYSNSWAEDRFLDREGMSTVGEAMQTGAEGLNGKNNIFVWAAGNERKKGGNANYFAHANSHYAIAVAAAGKTGIYEEYSNPGANVLINAPVPSCTTDLPGDEGYNPWGLDLRSLGNYVLTSLTFEQLQQEQIPESILQQLQTLKDHEFYLKEKFLAALQQQIGEEQLKIYQDTLLYYAYHSLKFRVDGLGEFENKNYTRDFAGTSAATPFVAGVIALMRQANSSLTYRDVRAILIQTAFRNQYNDPEYKGWEKDGVYPFSHDYGFGRVNAKAAVEMALTWKNLPNEREAPVIVTKEKSIPIPEDDQGISPPITIDVEQDMLIEFIEITFKANHSRWCDLDIVLISPSHTTSILTEPQTFCEKNKLGVVDTGYGYNSAGWRLGSVRHFGEHSKGTWTLTVKDKRSGETGTFKSVELKIYGTDLATPPYVKAVKASISVAEQPAYTLYHAGWTLADGQLTWTAFEPSSALPAELPFTVRVTASQPMKTMRVAIAGKTYPLTVVKDSNDAVWETNVTLPGKIGTQEYPLTITGVDTTDTPLLAFADQTPKPYPPVDATPSDAGDTAHRLKTFAAYGWSITTPDASDCHEQGNGVVCPFGTPSDDGGTGHYGSITLLPVGRIDQQAVALSPLSNSARHVGIYVMPEGGLEFAVMPNAKWFGECEEDTASARCPDSLDCQGESANMPQCRLPGPPEQPETKTLPWKITTAADATSDTCRIAVTYTLPEGGAKEVALAIQPARICDTLTDRNGETGVQEAQAVCAWEKVKTTNVYASNEDDGEDTSIVFDNPSIGYVGSSYDKYNCDSHFNVRNYNCVEEPTWQQCPPSRSTYKTVPTADGSGTRNVLISTLSYQCHTWFEEQYYYKPGGWFFDGSYFWASPDNHDDENATFYPYMIGWYQGTGTITSTNWSGESVSQCDYERTTQRIEPPTSEMGLNLTIPLRDSELME